MSTMSEARQKQQAAILESGKEVEAGNIADLPVDLETLKNIDETSPLAVKSFTGGLTAVVHKLEIGGKFYTLKKKRENILVHNIDGQTSFINEVQRRRDFEELRKKDAAACAGIVSTIYASINHGIILSPWIDGGHIERYSADVLDQIFAILISMELGGVFEYDPTSGNLLFASDGRVMMYDFGYAYRFDPRYDFNPDGLEVPVFHAAERFETRCFMQHLMDVEEYISRSAALSLYALEKESALKAYIRKLRWLEDNGGADVTLTFVRGYIELWEKALASPAELERTLALESFRSWVLDIHDDVGGKSCTPDTLRKADKVIAIAKSDYGFLAAHGGLFWGDEKLAKDELVKRYESFREDARQFQISRAESAEEWHRRRKELILAAYGG